MNEGESGLGRDFLFFEFIESLWLQLVYVIMLFKIIIIFHNYYYYYYYYWPFIKVTTSSKSDYLTPFPYPYNPEKDVHVIYQIKIEIDINNDELLRIIWEHLGQRWN
jgi:hypothetical protein